MGYSLKRAGWTVGLTLVILLSAGAALGTPPARSGEATRSDGAPVAIGHASEFTITLATVVPSGLSNPAGLAHAGDDSGRLFVVEQSGYIRIIKNGALLSTPYLTVTSKVLCCGERGLLSVVFDPDYQANGVFYLYYTATNGDVTIERYTTASPLADVAAVVSSTVILSVAHPLGNHNGGQLQFGPDGYLYAGLGDGGGAGDQENKAQNPAELLGKILRLNVRGVPTYTIPASNPFTQTAGYRPEIWAVGLRNPWRFSFDRDTGDLYIGDVGQDCFEEIDYQPAASAGGENYGWRLMEGFHQFDPANMTNCNQPVITPAGITRPITEYRHPTGDYRSVTGGYVYRGSAYPQLAGWYFYADYLTGQIWAITQAQPGVWSGAEKLLADFKISTFGEDEQGELYVAEYSSAGTGALYRLASITPSDFSASTKTASAQQARTGQTVTYTISLRNSGAPPSSTLRVTDVVPAGLSYTLGSLTAPAGTVDDSTAPTLTWNGLLSNTSSVTLTYAATIATTTTRTIVNAVTIDPGDTPRFTRTASVLVNPYTVFLPLVRRD